MKGVSETRSHSDFGIRVFTMVLQTMESHPPEGSNHSLGSPLDTNSGQAQHAPNKEEPATGCRWLVGVADIRLCFAREEATPLVSSPLLRPVSRR